MDTCLFCRRVEEKGIGGVFSRAGQTGADVPSVCRPGSGVWTNQGVAPGVFVLLYRVSVADLPAHPATRFQGEEEPKRSKLALVRFRLQPAQPFVQQPDSQGVRICPKVWTSAVTAVTAVPALVRLR